MKSAVKRTYHPMFIALFIMNGMDKKHWAQIPKSTRHQWQQTHQEDMFGFEFISNYALERDAIKEMFDVSSLQKSSIAICKVYRCIRKITLGLKGYKSSFKKQTAVIIETIEHLSISATLKSACKLFNISTQKFYRLKKNYTAPLP